MANERRPIDPLEIVSAVIGVVAVPWASILGPVVELLRSRLRGSLGLPEPDIETELAGAGRSLQKALEHAQGLQKRVNDERANLEVAVNAYHHYKTMAAAEHDKIQPWLDEVRKAALEEGRRASRESSRRERYWAFGIGLVANVVVFVGGVLMAEPVKAGWTALRGWLRF
jgi:hypothetical protein